ncbi:F0F1 ATP synthase subunit gamma [Novosphingobium mangrovi (ex Huang et al. 2023)]|uniref:F0F1 ATP synthase subunit gamma n=1 Tax=Novosphingobium mangrovi (ex Huang et al. 2023) TaxID=2976432 RepID=A0ABT2I0X2_9SPHN|nr:FoF1 ATP synthase subunit gamma [Novosphingobium mangrovi (ex Huang et al. 2023)]MCT2398451.1 F0F1 ATP synthase subunit gamma [Novosphingobium mangrovi (ex Huang et al. 2023)]
MAERLSDVEARIDSVRQLSMVISAMRGIASVRSHEASARLPGIRDYADTIGSAIAQALALFKGADIAPDADGEASGRLLVLALCAEQGFVGAFNTHILDAVQALIDAAGADRSDILMVGTRGIAAARERGLEPAESMVMTGHADQLTALANRLADRLFARLQGGAVSRVVIVGAQPPEARKTTDTVVPQTLIPFDFARFPATNRAQAPLVHLPAPILLERLTNEYVFAQLCEALTLSYAAENEARMRAMIAARENVARKVDELTATARRLRQEQITEELIELASAVKE